MKDEWLKNFIEYLETTKKSSWCEKVVRTKDGKNCMFGHLFNYAKDENQENEYWDMFENCYATTYMIYPVNDGKNKNYKQGNAKDRVIDYLKNILTGKEKSTMQLMDECYERSLRDRTASSS